MAKGARSSSKKRSDSRLFPDILTIDELAAYVRLSRSSLYHYSRAGMIPGRKVGRHWRYHKAAIDRWIQNEAARKTDGRRRPK